jgi:hypothetical protein
LISIHDGPKRSVELTITTSLLNSEIAKPRGEISPSEVRGIVLERRRWLFRDVIRLWLQTDERDIDFYRSRSMFDVALLLDELDAVIGPRPRTLKNIKEAEQAGTSNGG